MKIEALKNKKIAVLGFGKEGKSVVDFLEKIGSTDIVIHDKNDVVTTYQSITGEKYLENLDQYDILIKTPGISPYINHLEKYKDKITSSIEIFLSNYQGKVIGITGTKGKSTTSTLLFKTLEQAQYNVKLVGNIGNPVLEEVDILHGEEYDYIVFEMSSFMLEGIDAQLYIGYLNNLYDCHLDWHDGKNNYSNAKKNILKGAKHKLANIQTKDLLKDLSDVIYFGDNTVYKYNDNQFFIEDASILKDENILLQGAHNRVNITGIITILDTIKHDKHDSQWILTKLIESLKTVLITFSGLPNRIEDIGIYKGITFIDDAIATTPDSTIAALKTFDNKVGTLFLGGQDSGFSQEQYKNLIEQIQESQVQNIVLFPDTGETIFGDLSQYTYESEFDLRIGTSKIHFLKTKSMEQAVQFGYTHTEQGKICLLSTAAPSFSLWKGYLYKSAEFQKYVKKYSNK